jgi:hypothetical protein
MELLVDRLYNNLPLIPPLHVGSTSPTPSRNNLNSTTTSANSDAPDSRALHNTPTHKFAHIPLGLIFYRIPPWKILLYVIIAGFVITLSVLWYRAYFEPDAVKQKQKFDDFHQSLIIMIIIVTVLITIDWILYELIHYAKVLRAQMAANKAIDTINSNYTVGAIAELLLKKIQNAVSDAVNSSRIVQTLRKNAVAIN